MPPVKQKVTFPNGESIELFYIGSLANALGRTPTTVRQWEIGGIIPDPCFRDKRNNRLYSQKQIDAIVQCAERAKIRSGYPISKTSFTKWVFKELEKIKLEYKSKETKNV